MKKILTAICFGLILTAAIITTGRTIRVLAANTTEMTQDGFEYLISGEDEEAHIVILGYGGDAVEVTVPSEIKGVPVTEIGDRAFMYNPEIVKLVLPESVTTVHERSFWYLDQLEDVTLGGVKYFRNFSGLLVSKVTQNLFGHCEQLKRVTFGDACCFYEEERNDGKLNLFPEDVLNHLEYLYIGNGMPKLPEYLFWGNSLKEIEAGSDNEHYSSVNGVLFDSEKKTLLTAPIAFEGDTFVVPYGVETIARYGFDACKNIKKIYIPQTVETFEKRFTISPTLYVVQGSAGETFAKENGFSFQYFGVYFNMSSLSVSVGESASLQVTNETERSLTWNSSDASVADINSNGTVTAKKAGTAVISVSDGREFTAKCTVTVTEGGGTPEVPNPPEVKPGGVKNPVHHCTKKDDGSDYTDWSYVYFGSYPQSEVTSWPTALTEATYDENGDAWVNGTRYRKISKSDTNFETYFGSDYRYFKWEPIKWRVLSVNENTMLVVADQGLDCKDYHDLGGSVTWENCTLRNWLNMSFYKMAFNSSEQQAIVEQTVVNDGGHNHMEEGNDTRDHIFLLSYSEILNPEYGFCEDCDTASASRWMRTSKYADVRGAYIYKGSSSIGNDNCRWWLRSPGSKTDNAVYCDVKGDVEWIGCLVNSKTVTVVPALYIDLSSNLWSLAETDDTPDSAGQLNNAKQQSKLELESYKNASDYRDAQKAELANAIQSGKNEIDKATNETEVRIALNTAKAAIDRIKTDAQLTSEELGADGSGKQNATPSPQPTSFKGKIKAKAKWIQIKWQKKSGVTGYEIQISRNKKFKKSTYTRKLGSSQSSIRITGLKPKTKYYVRIRTYQTADGKVYYSKWSKKKSVKTKK